MTEPTEMSIEDMIASAHDAHHKLRSAMKEILEQNEIRAGIRDSRRATLPTWAVNMLNEALKP